MKIAPAYLYNSNPQSFQGNRRTVYDKSGNFLYRTTTYFFREDLDWNSFVKLLKYKYNNAQKVNIISHICSNGQEPYSLVVKLIQILGDDASKFFPIIAKDIDQDNIESAKRGKLGIKAEELYRINYQTNGNTSEFFDKGCSTNPQSDLVLIPKPHIKNKVIFSQSDILNDIDSIPTNNTILMCRNFWPYLEPHKREVLAKKISQKLDDTSLVLVGDFDAQINVHQLLKNNGFKETGIENVYSKTKSSF